MYAPTEQKNVTLEQRTEQVERSIQMLLELVGPTDVERRPKFKRIDILTTPIQFEILQQALQAMEHSISAAARSFELTDAINVETQV